MRRSRSPVRSSRPPPADFACGRWPEMVRRWMRRCRTAPVPWRSCSWLPCPSHDLVPRLVSRLARRAATEAMFMRRLRSAVLPGQSACGRLQLNRRGGAILLVLAAAALLAFAAIGALAAASELHRQELAERSILHAELAAESALARRLASWDAREHASRPFWLLDAAAAAGTLAFTHLQAAGAG